MEIPFTVNQFFDIFEVYNKAIWPAQLMAYALGAAAVLFALRDKEAHGRLIAAILALFWMWMAVAYHFMYFSQINPAARVFGAFFILQGLALARAGCLGKKLRFTFAWKPIPLIGALFMAYAFLIYPLIGTLFGHSFPRSPVFGVAPCPATIFTFGLFLWAARPVPLYVVVIPFLWSLIGLSAAVNLHVPQDYGLGLAGILGTVLIIINNKLHKKVADNHSLAVADS